MKFIKSNAILFSTGFVVVLIIAVVLSFSKSAEAKVYGQCANCHTMHNSQNGTGMVQVRGDEIDASKGGTCVGCHGEPRENLLTLSCIACHAMDLTPGSALPVFDAVYPIPQVVYQTTSSLAAGNFYYMFKATGPGTDFNGHNVHGFGTEIDADFNQGFPVMPPGYDSNMDYVSSAPVWPKPGSQPGEMLCAGTYGCHGNREVVSQTQAIAGSHHANDYMLKFATLDTALQGSSSGTSYRFLSGVKGGEHVTWESNATSSNHNEYLGDYIGSPNRTTNSQTAGQIDTMSEFCAGCHGNFHMVGGAAGTGLGNPSPWIRHPTDVLIPDTSPYDLYTTFNLTAPVARIAIDSSYPLEDTEITGAGAGNAVVFCLSCHRAHASEEYDSLRFSYDKILTGSGGGVSGDGCFACHGDK